MYPPPFTAGWILEQQPACQIETPAPLPHGPRLLCPFRDDSWPQFLRLFLGHFKCPPVTTHPPQLYGLGKGPPVRLAIPAGLESPSHVFDELPRGVYEAMRTFNGHQFVGLEQHLQRAMVSMDRFGITPPIALPDLRNGLHGIATAFPGDAKIRIDFLQDPASTLNTNARVIALATQLILPAPVVYSQGVRCLLAHQLRRDRPEIKSSEWVVNRRPAEGGTPQNYESILVNSEGRLLEGVMSNLFAVKKGVLYTAPVVGVLPGVTRSIILSLAGQSGIPFTEVAIHCEELHQVDEAFFSTSVRSIVPVVSINEVPLGLQKPGPITHQLMDAYASYCQSESRPAIG